MKHFIDGAQVCGNNNEYCKIPEMEVYSMSDKDIGIMYCHINDYRKVVGKK
jgi:hypothetical protein